MSTDPTKGSSYYGIYAVRCINAGEKALSQQWIISAPFVKTPPIKMPDPILGQGDEI